MKRRKQIYHKNFSLIIAFLILISISLVFALALGYNLTQKYIENEFASQKIDVLEQTVKPYNDLFQNKIPEISFYQGFLDSASAIKYLNTIFTKFPFVERAFFYDASISNHKITNGFKVNNFTINPKAVYQFGRNILPDSVVLFKDNNPNSLSMRTTDEFNKMAVKFTEFIESSDTSKTLSNDDIFNVFYSITPNRITYMNIPRQEELKIFKNLMFRNQPPSLFYEQDMLTFYLNPLRLQIKNTHPELYQHILIKPLVYESLDNEPEIISNDIPLPGAFSDYKLYFSSNKAFLVKEVNSRFLPIASGLLIVYGMLVLIAYVIFRNLNVNSKMFKLQHDFIDNLTHEFKTPVSVIKIAGNNISSASHLSNHERTHYGKILDEEADKLNYLMNRLLSFTQIENKAIKLKEERVELSVFCENIINTYKLKYPNFHLHYHLEKVEYYKTDPILLASIFQNLMDNAYKYSLPEKKELNITIQKVKKNIVFCFIDKGIGIPQKEIENIFEKFYRIQNQYNQQGSVGLGLALCKELVNFMNGSITVKSREGKGSEFIIELPYEN